MTVYVAAYDTESPKCLAACRKIVEMHRKHDVPASFFIVGKVLEANPDEYRELLDDPFFEIASHTYSPVEKPWLSKCLTVHVSVLDLAAASQTVLKVRLKF